MKGHFPFAYHTAVGEDSQNYPDKDYISEGKVTAFTHDVMNPYFPMDRFSGCDVFWVEPAGGQAGMETFYNRANKQAKQSLGYDELVGRIHHILKRLQKPAFVLEFRRGKRMEAAIQSAQDHCSVRIAQATATLLSFNTDIPVSPEERTKDLVHWGVLTLLAERYNCVGDFCCGYGLTGAVFASKGKGSVLSDLNPKCVGYIATAIPKWFNKKVDN